jgi:hypothetical protein
LRLEATGPGERRRKPWEKPPQPWTLERARAFKMPIGKYKGRTIGQIALADPEYLAWCAETMDRNIGMAAKTYLAGEGQPVPVGPAEEFDEFGEQGA